MTASTTTPAGSKYCTAYTLLGKVYEMSVNADASKTASDALDLPDDVEIVGIITGTATATITRQRSVDASTGAVTCAQVTLTPLLASTVCTAYILIR